MVNDHISGDENMLLTGYSDFVVGAFINSLTKISQLTDIDTYRVPLAASTRNVDYTSL